MTVELLGVKMGEPRTYLTQLPAGLALSPAKQDWKFGGTDVLFGTRQGIQFRQISVTWYEGRAANVMAMAHGATDAVLEEMLKTIAGLASLKFEYESRGENFLLKCGDGLRVMATKSQAPNGPGPMVPLLVLSIDHPLRWEMEKAIREGRR